MSELTTFLGIHPVPNDLIEVTGKFDFTKTISKPYWVFLNEVSWDTAIRCETGKIGWVEYKEHPAALHGPVEVGHVRVYTSRG